MKKAVIVLMILSVLMFGIIEISDVSVCNIASAMVSESECDEVFSRTINELIVNEVTEDTYCTARKKIVYDLNIEPLGYLYSFVANGDSGFAIVINSQGIYECSEIYFKAANPYDSAKINGLAIYVNLMTYWVYSDGVFYDTPNGEIISDSIIEAAHLKAYFSVGDSLDYVQETINYVLKTDNKYPMVNKHPHISSTTPHSGCVSIMGANIIQFFDRYAVNLIPNYTPGNQISTIYRYRMPSSETATVTEQLSLDIGVNDGAATIPQFKKGMAKYCSDRGYTFTYASCMNNGQFNYGNAKNQMGQGKPIALFLDPYSIESIAEFDNYDKVEHRYSAVPHAMAAFGSREITYTLSNGNVRNDVYLQVATGNLVVDEGYCKVNGSTVIDEALAINIY